MDRAESLKTTIKATIQKEMEAEREAAKLAGIPELPSVPVPSQGVAAGVSSPDLQRRLAALTGGLSAVASSAPASSSSLSSTYIAPIPGFGQPAAPSTPAAGAGPVANIAPLAGPPDTAAASPTEALVGPSSAYEAFAEQVPGGGLAGLGGGGSQPPHSANVLTSSQAHQPDALSAALLGVNLSGGNTEDVNLPYAPLSASRLYALLSVEESASEMLILDTRSKPEYRASHLVSSGTRLFLTGCFFCFLFLFFQFIFFYNFYRLFFCISSSLFGMKGAKLIL